MQSEHAPLVIKELEDAVVVHNLNLTRQALTKNSFLNHCAVVDEHTPDGATRQRARYRRPKPITDTSKNPIATNIAHRANNHFE